MALFLLDFSSQPFLKDFHECMDHVDNTAIKQLCTSTNPEGQLFYTAAQCAEAKGGETGEGSGVREKG